MSKALTYSVVAAALLSGAGLADTEQYGLGKPASSEIILARSISIAPDGTGLPTGRGNAKEGRALYEAQCAACHGTRGEGVAEYPPLAGGKGTLSSKDPVLTVGSYWPHATTVWDYINRAMPYQAPGTLNTDEVYAITAYVLFLNGIVRETDALDARTLPRIQMPNRNGFVDDRRPDVTP